MSAEINTGSSEGRKSYLLPLIILAVLVAAGAVYYFFFSEEAGREPLSAQITKVEGDVLVQREGEAVAVTAESGQELNSGDILTTAAESFAEIAFDDGSVSRAGADTRLVFADLYRTRDGSDVTVLAVEPGRLWNSVKELTQRNSRFEVRTPTSVAGVRGTAFSVDVRESAGDAENDNGDDDASQNNNKLRATYRVYEGSVGVSGGTEEKDTDDISISAGEQGSVDEDEFDAPPSQKLDVLEVDDWERDNLVEDIPVVYVEVESETNTVLTERTEAEINEGTGRENALRTDLEMLQGLLATETDAAKRAEIEELITLTMEEIDLVLELRSSLEEDKEELIADKERIEGLRKKIDEQKDVLDRDELNNIVRDEARTVREEQRARTPKRQERLDKRRQGEEAIREREEKRSTTSRNIGIELTSVRDAESDAAPEPEPEETTTQPAPSPTPSPSPSPTPTPEPEPEEEPAPTTYDISINRNITAGGSVSGGGSYNSGSNATITASPATGYRFVQWVSAGTSVSTSSSHTFSVSVNRTYTAVFEPITYSISLSANPAAGGSITGGGSYNHGASVALTARPATGYRFKNWSEGGNVVSTSASYSFTANASRTLIANFEEKVSYNITTRVSPEGSGSVEGGGTFPEGDSVTLTATAADEYRFKNWTDGETVLSTSPSYSFTTKSHQTITANFERVKYIINLNVTPEDGGSVSGDGLYESGEEVTVTATAADGFRFEKWSAAGSEVSTESSYTFTADSDRTLTAVFTELVKEPEEDPVIVVGMVPASGEKWISGQDWVPDREVTITIRDNGNMIFEEKVITQDEEHRNMFIDLSPITLEPGYTVTATDGVSTVTHVIKNLFITDTDMENSIVYGTADPGSMVTVELLVWIAWVGPDFLHTIYAEADTDGNWSADFGAAGYDDLEYKEVRASQTDENDNTTLVSVGYWPEVNVDPMHIHVDKPEYGDTIVEGFSKTFILYLGYTDFVADISPADFRLEGFLSGLSITDVQRGEYPRDANITVSGDLVITEEEWIDGHMVEGAISILGSAHTGADDLSVRVEATPSPDPAWIEPHYLELPLYDGDADVTFNKTFDIYLSLDEFKQDIAPHDFILGEIFTSEYADIQIVKTELNPSEGGYQSQSVAITLSGTLNISEEDWYMMEWWADGSITALASAHSGSEDYTLYIAVSPPPESIWTYPHYVNIHQDTVAFEEEIIIHLGYQDFNVDVSAADFALGGFFTSQYANLTVTDAVKSTYYPNEATITISGTLNIGEEEWDSFYWPMEGTITALASGHTGEEDFISYVFLGPPPEAIYADPNHTHLDSYEGEDVYFEEHYGINLGYDRFIIDLQNHHFTLGGIFSNTAYTDANGLSVTVVNHDMNYAEIKISGVLNVSRQDWEAMDNHVEGTITLSAAGHSGEEDLTAHVYLHPTPVPHIHPNYIEVDMYDELDGTPVYIEENFELVLEFIELFNEDIGPADFSFGGVFADPAYADLTISSAYRSGGYDDGAWVTLSGYLNISPDDWENHFVGTITAEASGHTGGTDFIFDVTVAPGAHLEPSPDYDMLVNPSHLFLEMGQEHVYVNERLEVELISESFHENLTVDDFQLVQLDGYNIDGFYYSIENILVDELADNKVTLDVMIDIDAYEFENFMMTANGVLSFIALPGGHTGDLELSFPLAVTPPAWMVPSIIHVEGCGVGAHYDFVGDLFEIELFADQFIDDVETLDPEQVFTISDMYGDLITGVSVTNFQRLEGMRMHITINGTLSDFYCYDPILINISPEALSGNTAISVGLTFMMEHEHYYEGY